MFSRGTEQIVTPRGAPLKGLFGLSGLLGHANPPAVRHGVSAFEFLLWLTTPLTRPDSPLALGAHRACNRRLNRCRTNAGAESDVRSACVQSHPLSTLMAGASR